MLLNRVPRGLVRPPPGDLRPGAGGGSLPLVTITDSNGLSHAEPLCHGNGVDAQDMTELRRMTCPAGQLNEDCPHLKALAADCRQHNLYNSASALAMRRHSDDGQDGRGRAYWLRLAKSHMLSGYHNLKAKLSPSNDVNFFDEGRRHIIVEQMSNEKRKCKSSDDISCVISRDAKEQERNISTSLVIHSLKEGRLTAEISLEELPADEDVIIRIRNFTLELLTQKKGHGKKSNGKVKDGAKVDGPIKCGKIDIPIYVDPGTLWFELIDNRTLVMQGDTKTSLPRPPLQNSHDEMRKPNNSTRATSPSVRRLSNATWYINSPSERPGFYRQRSYTH